VVAGNVTGTTNICQTCGDPTVNGFAKCSSTSCSMSFDGTNTTITNCGNCGLPPNPHFGADGGTGSSRAAEPFLSVVTDQNPGPNPVYLVVYVRGTSTTGEYLGTWFADAYAPGANVLIAITRSRPFHLWPGQCFSLEAAWL